MGVRIHHFFSNKLSLEFFAPECSVPAIGCPGIRLHFSFAKSKVVLLKHFFTDPTSVIIVSLLEIKGKISVTSPISRSLVGKSEGDHVTIKTPSGDLNYEIIEVKYV